MLHPSYSRLIDNCNQAAQANNEGLEVQSRYSIVLAAATRARQLVDGNDAHAVGSVDKPLSIAVAELDLGQVVITKPEEPVSAQEEADAEEA